MSIKVVSADPAFYQAPSGNAPMTAAQIAKAINEGNPLHTHAGDLSVLAGDHAPVVPSPLDAWLNDCEAIIGRGVKAAFVRLDGKKKRRPGEYPTVRLCLHPRTRAMLGHRVAYMPVELWTMPTHEPHIVTLEAWKRDQCVELIKVLLPTLMEGAK